MNGRLYLYGDAVRLVDDAGSERRQLAVVLVPNNPYALDRPPPRGTRPALDTGQLGIVVLDVPGDSAPFPGPAPGRAGPGGQCPQIGARGYRR